MMTTTADTPKLYQRVADAVASRIQAGVYGPGQRLPSERDLAEEFGVSRPTVREAMIALEIRRLVEARPGSGAYVTPGAPNPSVSAPELDIGAFELTEARMLFEGEACALAATTITDEELAALERILHDMAEENTSPGFAGEHADRRFHIAIAEATRNSAIVEVVGHLWDLRHRSPLSATMLQRSREVGVRPLIDDHREIWKALCARNARKAREAMRAHLSRVIDDLLVATEADAVSRARSEASARRNELARRAAV